MLKRKKIELTIAPAALDKIKSMGISQEFGAREIDRVIRNDIKPLFVDEILFGKLQNGGSIRLEVQEGAFAVLVEE